MPRQGAWGAARAAPQTPTTAMEASERRSAGVAQKPPEGSTGHKKDWFLVDLPETSYWNGFCAICQAGYGWNHVDGKRHASRTKHPEVTAWCLFNAGRLVEKYNLNPPEDVAAAYRRYIADAEGSELQTQSWPAKVDKRSKPGITLDLTLDKGPFSGASSAAAQAAADESMTEETRDMLQRKRSVQDLAEQVQAGQLNLLPCEAARAAGSHEEVFGSEGIHQEPAERWTLLTCGEEGDMQEVQIEDTYG